MKNVFQEAIFDRLRKYFAEEFTGLNDVSETVQRQEEYQFEVFRGVSVFQWLYCGLWGNRYCAFCNSLFIGLTLEKWQVSWRDGRDRNEKQEGRDERRGWCKSELQRICVIYLLTSHHIFIKKCTYKISSGLISFFQSKTIDTSLGRFCWDRCICRVQKGPNFTDNNHFVQRCNCCHLQHSEG